VALLEVFRHYGFIFDVAKGAEPTGLPLFLAAYLERDLTTLKKMTGFYKNENCPSSHELLGFEKGELPDQRGSAIRRHIATCEFCAAEVDFYSHYPQAEGTTEPAEIPAPPYELAEAILKNRHSDSASLNALLKETEPDLVAEEA
jgi:hypothetical protein